MKKTSFSRSLSRFFLAIAVAASVPSGVALAQEPSAVDIAQARDLFNEGLKLREQGDAKGALEKLKAANRLAQTPIVGLELGRTYEQLGDLVEARETFLSIGRIAQSASETARSAKARAEAERLARELRPRIPTLIVQITGATASEVAVTIDGTAVPPEALEAPRPVNPGAHEVVGRSTNGATAKATVDVKEGENRSAELNIVATIPQATPVTSPNAVFPSPPVARGGMNPLVYVGFGLAGAGLAVGGVTGALAISKASTVSHACPNLMCTTTGESDVQTGRTLGNISTAAFIAAGVGAVAGVIGLVLSHRTEEGTSESIAPWIGPRGAGVVGTF
jgi:hypothetical protein